MFEEIDAAFNIAGKPVIFAWGGTIYNPLGISVTVELQAHEAVHCERQGDDPAAWWRLYIGDIGFRAEEEIVAHRAEYATYCRRHLNKRKRMRFLQAIAGRLCGGLYGSVFRVETALVAITAKVA